MTTLLDINAITCRYDDKVIFAGLSFGVAAGSIACLLGPSGCGKTTALRAIAGFEPVYAGSITLDGRTLSAPGMTLPPEQRQVGMVFQDYALFPHLSVAANIGFGLQQHGKADRQRITGELLDLIRLQDCAKAYPHQLSGGQQQRVALARALAPRPKLLLLDEPFSNLDTALRRSLSLEVRDILRQHGTTAILVTHDQTEAFNVADVIGVMAQGKLLQWGTARELYQAPQSPFVASFVSSGAFIRGELVAPGRLRTAFGEITLEAHDDLPTTPGASVDLLLRPWNVVLAESGPCSARIIAQQFQGAYTLTSLQLADGTVLASHDERLTAFPAGTSVKLALDPRLLRAFAR
jgi:iron(III) transport system ATP-binding protein